ncbi:MAG: hypothetical protein WKF58_09770 [Ilumatobacteraceae bacterium]
MACTCTGTPAGHEPNSATGAQACRSNAACARSGLSQLLRRHHPEREPGVDDAAGQFVRCANAALADLPEADLTGVRHALVEGLERAAVVEVGRVHRVPRSTQFVGKGEEPRRLSLRMVEQQHFGHLVPFTRGSAEPTPPSCGA